MSDLSHEISRSLDILENEQRNISHEIRNNIISSQNEIVSEMDHSKDSGNSLKILKSMPCNLIILVCKKEGVLMLKGFPLYKASLRNHERFIENLLNLENERSVVNSMQKLWQYLFKVDKAAESLSVKVSKLEASCVSKTQFCDQKKVRNLEHKIDVHSQKVDQYVAQNLKISRNLSDKMVRMEKQMEILFQNILS